MKGIRWGIGLALVSQALALPVGVWIREEQKDECCDARLEIVDGGEAFYRENQNFAPAKIDEAGGPLHVEVAGKTRWTLTPDGRGWIDQDQRHWAPREALLKINPAWTDLRIRVTDQHGKIPEEFGFLYSINSAAGGWDPLLVKPLVAKNGIIDLKAPGECEIHLSPEHPDFVRGYGTSAAVERKNGTKELTAEFKLGLSVRGTVVDDATGKPVAGAVVSPRVFTPPLFTDDVERSVSTGTGGEFKLRGVHGQFSVKHADYIGEEIYLPEKAPEKAQKVRLKKGITIQGSVTGLEGKPLADVKVDDGSGKSCQSDNDGHFELRGLGKWNDKQWNLTFSKKGYNDFTFEEERIDPAGLTVKMQPLPTFRGRVALPNGEPARKFRVICGPGPAPQEFECEEFDIHDSDGRFEIQPDELPGQGSDFWLGVSADAAAPWDGVVTQKLLESGDFRIDLQPGVSVTASLALPESAKGKIEIQLDPMDRLPTERHIVSDHPGRKLAACGMILNPSETLRISHLRPGDYQLRVRCQGATPLKLPVKVSKANADLGELRLAGTGTITGVVNEPYGKKQAWRFAPGQIHVAGFNEGLDEPFMTFKSDHEGRFRVDDIPAGKVTVEFPYNQTADIIGSLSREVRVQEGAESEVRFEGTGGAWSQPLQLLFDGKAEIPASKGVRKVDNVTDRKPMFRFEVEPLGAVPASWSDSLEWSSDEKPPPLIPDLSPGRWRIRVFDWLGSRGFDEGLRAETIADVGNPRVPVQLMLGGRCYTGLLKSSRETKRLIAISAVGRKTGKVYRSRCDDEGNFVIRYLPEDEYLLHAHDDDGGWCDLGAHPLDKPVVDCGIHTLLDGGHVSGSISPKSPSPMPSISALGADGLEIPLDELEENGSFRFGNLRPGHWTILARSGEQEIARVPVTINKGETVELTPVSLKAR